MSTGVVMMMGSHPRHFAVARSLKEGGHLRAMVVEQREDFVPEPDPSWDPHYQELFRLHFEKRRLAEKEAFGGIDPEEICRGIPCLRASREELNSEKVLGFLREHQSPMLVSYGVHRLSPDVISLFPEKAFNIHGGLSPWFRGNTTLFWPFYFLKPNYAGMTIHRLSERLDGGDILHHSLPELRRGDGIHDVASRAVLQVAEDLRKILARLDQGTELRCVPQKSPGKLFVTSDWTPQTLTVIYDLFGDRIVDRFLDGTLIRDDPEVVDFFRNCPE